MMTDCVEPDAKVKFLLAPKDAAAALGISISTLKRLVADGALPKPKQISENRVGHRYIDLETYANDRGDKLK